jgi:hypothetical protein
MQRTKILSDIVTIPTTAGTASSISSATCVRLHNNTSGIVTVSISTSVGAGTTYSFSIPGDSVEFLEKLPTDVIYATSGIKVNKVAFTN